MSPEWIAVVLAGATLIASIAVVGIVRLVLLSAQRSEQSGEERLEILREQQERLRLYREERQGLLEELERVRTALQEAERTPPELPPPAQPELREPWPLIGDSLVVAISEGEERENMSQSTNKRPSRQQQSSSLLSTERGNTTISDTVVAQVGGIAAQEVEGVQMGGGAAAAAVVGGFVQSVTGTLSSTTSGSGNYTRGVSVEVGQEEAAIDLSMAIEYGKSIPQTTELARRKVIERVESLVGLRVREVNIAVNDVQIREEWRA